MFFVRGVRAILDGNGLFALGGILSLPEWPKIPPVEVLRV